VIVALVLSIAFAVFPGQDKAPEEYLPVLSWSDWKDFGKESWVAWEIRIGDKKARKRITLKEKGPDRLMFEEVLQTGDRVQPAQERVLEKPKGGAGVYDTVGTTECPRCKKPWTGHKGRQSSESSGNIKVQEKEVPCKIFEIVYFDCDGTDLDRTKSSFSQDVPGELVRQERRTKTLQYIILCVGFEKK
jgi:hypothetical protein